MIALLRDPAPAVRYQAGTSLLMQEGSHKVAALTRALGAKDAGLRFEAARVLGRIGLDARGNAMPATRALLKTLGDPVERVRVCAAWAVSRLGVEDVGALRVLTAGLSSGQAAVREESLRGLSEFSSRRTEFLAQNKPVELVGSLLSMLKEHSARDRAFAATLLGHCGEDSKRVAVALGQAVADPDEDTSVAAAFSLSRLPSAKPPERALKVLCQWLDAHAGGLERRKACWALERINQFPPFVVKTLTSHLGDEDKEDRLEVACLLSRRPGTAAGVIERIALEAVRGDVYGFPTADRVNAVEALGRLGLLSPQARHDLVQAQSDPDEKVRTAAAQLLRHRRQRSAE
jgi:HEAT repeat protein